MAAGLGEGKGEGELVVEVAWEGPPAVAAAEEEEEQAAAAVEGQEEQVAAGEEEGQGLAQDMLVPWRRVQRTWWRCLRLPQRQ